MVGPGAADGGGLVVAEQDEYEVRVVQLGNPRSEGSHCVLDRMAVELPDGVVALPDLRRPLRLRAAGRTSGG